MKVLAIGAHFDDLELGCGGTLARHVNENDEVWGLVVTNSEYSALSGKVLRKKLVAREEGEKAASIIGYNLLCGNIDTYDIEPEERLNKLLLSIIEEKNIDTIYTHWENDVHHDHRNLSQAVLHVSKHVNRVLMYKSNWYDSTKAFKGDFYVDITDTWIKKEMAIKCYESEMVRVGDKWIKYFENEAINNGLKTNVKYAEVFEVVKWFR